MAGGLEKWSDPWGVAWATQGTGWGECPSPEARLQGPDRNSRMQEDSHNRKQRPQAGGWPCSQKAPGLGGGHGVGWGQAPARRTQPGTLGRMLAHRAHGTFLLGAGAG